MNILIINPSSYPKISAGRFHKFLTPMPPVGLAYLLAALEKAVFQPVFYDDFLEQGNDNKLKRLLTKLRPDIIGMPYYTSSLIYRVNRIVSIARDLFPQVKIVLGHLHAGVFAREILAQNEADIIVLGEGEQTICEIAQAIDKKTTLENIKGIVFRDSLGKIIDNGPGRYIKNLDEFPFPAWHLMPYKKYKMMDFSAVSQKGTFIIGSRGCPYGCSYCSMLIQGQTRRSRSAENICDEMEWLVEKFGFESVIFIDPIFSLPLEERFDLCREMIRRGLPAKMTWAAETRTELINEELLQLMHKAGCRKIFYGIECGTQTSLDVVQKKNNIENAKRAVALTKRAGITTTGFFIIGLPDETKEQIEETISFSLKLDLDSVKYSVMVPYPGTRSFDQLLAAGKIKKEDVTKWARYTSFPTLKTPPIYLSEKVKLKELILLQKKAYYKFYLRPKMIFRHLFILRTISLSAMKDALIFFSGSLLEDFLNIILRKK